MAQLELAEEHVSRVSAFKEVVEAILGNEITFEQCVELVLEQGLKCMLADILGSVKQSVLLESLQQLAKEHPSEIYSYVSDALRRGAVAGDIERLRKWRTGMPPLPRLEQ